MVQFERFSFLLLIRIRRNVNFVFAGTAINRIAKETTD